MHTRRPAWRKWLLAALGSACALTLAARPAHADGPPTRTVEFNRDIRPILSDTCFACHGPDQNTRKADLQLNTEEGAKGDRGGYVVIVPGKPEQSELFRRVSSKDPKHRMPPPKFGKQLSAAQV